MDNPSVSVVMAVRNVEKFLPEAIESILSQTFRDFEFIIVDFGSSDRSKSIVSAYALKDSRIRFHEIPECPLPAARNAACFLARGKYLAVMDADDVALPGRLMLQVEYMESNPHIALLGAATEWIDANGRSLEIHQAPCSDEDIRSELLIHCPFWHPTVFMRRESFISVKGYRTPFVYAHDYDLELRIAEHFKCANLPDAVLKYRIHPRQVSLAKLKQQTICRLACQASSRWRTAGQTDPLDRLSAIDEPLLAQMGISEAVVQSNLISEYRAWVRNMCIAGEHAGALDALIGILRSSDWRFVESWRIADLWLMASLLYWKQKQYWNSCLAWASAVRVHPILLARPLRPLLQRFRLNRGASPVASSALSFPDRADGSVSTSALDR